MSPNNEDSRKEEVQNPEQPIDNSFVLNEWAGGTSIHGVANIVDGLTWSWWKRCVWFVLVCCSASFMIWQITTLIQEYRNFEVLTETVTITPTAMDFPEITICDINDISRSKVEAAGLTRGPRNETELFQLSKTVEDLIGITIFNDEEFPDPTKVWSPVITFQGLCWQFSPKDRVVQRPGVHAGLWFSANLDPSDNLADSVISGLTLYAEQPGTPINDELASVMVEPGSDALVHIKKTDFHRERVAPWAVCRGDAPEYTETACRSICLMEEIRQTCGCRDKGDFTYDVETMGPLDYCGASETLSSEASNPVKYKTFDSCPNLEPEETILAACDCELPPCTATDYDMSVNEIRYNPSVDQQEGHEGEDIKNLVEVFVNYDQITYDVLEEERSTSFSTLLGSIGGSMGLFLGISFLSIVEVFGDLIPMRLLPRLCGYRNIHGIGARTADGP